jgi:hypothetical protein
MFINSNRIIDGSEHFLKTKVLFEEMKMSKFFDKSIGCGKQSLFFTTEYVLLGKEV